MKKKILVAEDEVLIRLLYCKILSPKFDVIEANDGLEAVQLYKEHEPDLILMDIKMPNMDGLQAITEIKKINPQANIVALTAYDYSESELKVPVMRKGLDNNEILIKINLALNGKE